MSGGTYPVAMTIRELKASDVERVTALWREVDLVRPWNDPDGDFHGAIAGATSAVLGAELEGLLVGTVMVGFDGHRGWLYYVAVAPSAQRSGVGTALNHRAEEWLTERGAHKVQLMVRRGNDEPRLFYGALGYEPSDVTVFQKWLTRDVT
jgi:ribosomal protein S18 acetylase RimI-like enzyme